MHFSVKGDMKYQIGQLQTHRKDFPNTTESSEAECHHIIKPVCEEFFLKPTIIRNCYCTQAEVLQLIKTHCGG